MAKKRINWAIILVVLIGILVLGLTAYGVRKWQRSRWADEGLTLGTRAFEEKNWSEAAAQFGRYLAREQEDIDILMKYAEAQLKIRPPKQNNIQQATQAYRNILRLDKGNVEAVKQLCQLYLMLKAPGEAELIVREALGSNPDIENQRQLVAALVAQRKYEEVTAELSKIMAGDDKPVWAYELTAQLADAHKEFFPEDETAEYWMSKMFEQHPNSADAYLARAMYYVKYRENEKARADLDKARNLVPDTQESKMRLAESYFILNDMPAGVEVLEEIKAANADSHALWRDLLMAARKTGSDEKVYQTIEDALASLSSSNRWDFLPTAIDNLIQLKKVERASECLEDIRKAEVLPGRVALWDGLIAQSKGDNYRAIASLQRALELGERSPQLRLMLAECLDKSGDRLSAQRCLELLIADQPNSAEAHYQLGRMLLRNHLFSQALNHGVRAEEIASSSRNTLLILQSRMLELISQKTDRNSQAWQALEADVDKAVKSMKDSASLKRLQLQMALQQEKYDQAESVLAELKTLHDDEAAVAGDEVVVLVAKKEFGRAEIKLQEMIKDNPDSVSQVMSLVNLYAMDDDKAECEKLLSDTIERLEGSSVQRDVGLTLAGLYRTWQQPEKSYELLTSLSEAMPNDIPLKRELLNAEEVQADKQQAQKIIDEIKSIEGEDGWQWRYEQARLWMGGSDKDFNENYQLLSTLLKENMTANPSDQGSRLLLASAYERAGELQMSASTCREALTYAPNDLAIMVMTIRALSRAGNVDEADMIMDRAARLNPNHPDVSRLMLQRHYRKGEFSDAEKILEAFLKDNPSDIANRLALARVKSQESKYEDAKVILDALRNEKPDSLEIAVASIELNVNLGDKERALQQCDELLNKDNSIGAAMACANVYNYLGQGDKALAAWDRAGKAAPENPLIMLRKHDYYRDHNQMENAVAAIENALNLAPDNLDIIKRAVITFLQSGKADQVEKGKALLEQALANSPKDVDLRLQKVAILLNDGARPAREQARSLLQQITEDSARDVRAWIQLARLYYEQENYSQAVNWAFQGLVHVPDNKDLLLLKARAESVTSPSMAVATVHTLLDKHSKDLEVILAANELLIAAGKADEAVKTLRDFQASRTDLTEPGKNRVTLAAALADYRAGNKEAALQILKKFQQESPQDPRPVLAQINLMKDDKRLAEIRELIKKWQERNPKDFATPMLAVEELINSGDIKAVEVCEEILDSLHKVAPDNTMVMFYQAMLMQKLGEDKQAADKYEKLLQANPNDAIAINNLSWILCENQHEYDRALTLAQRGLEIAPDYLDLVDTCGMIYYRMGKLDQAIEKFQRCVDLYPENSPSLVGSYYHLGRTQADKGLNAAATNLKQALTLNQQSNGLSAAEVSEIQELLSKLSQ